MLKWLAVPFILLIKLYQWVLSPFLGRHCRFEPTCSEYVRQALVRFGIAKGTWLALKRILRCHPWGGMGYDPVPKNSDEG